MSILFSRTTLILDLFTFFPKYSKVYVKANLWNGYIFKNKTFYLFYFSTFFFSCNLKSVTLFAGVMRLEMKDCDQ